MLGYFYSRDKDRDVTDWIMRVMEECVTQSLKQCCSWDESISKNSEIHRLVATRTSVTVEAEDSEDNWDVTGK